MSKCNKSTISIEINDKCFVCMFFFFCFCSIYLFHVVCDDEKLCCQNNINSTRKKRIKILWNGVVIATIPIRYDLLHLWILTHLFVDSLQHHIKSVTQISMFTRSTDRNLIKSSHFSSFFFFFVFLDLAWKILKIKNW